MRWYFVKGSVNYLHKTQDVIGCLLLQSDDNPPRYWLFQFPLVFHLTVLSHLVTYLIITIFNDVHHDPVRYWFFRVSVLQWSPNWFSSTLQSPDNSFPHSSLSHLSECNSDLVYSPPVPPLRWEPTPPPLEPVLSHPCFPGCHSILPLQPTGNLSSLNTSLSAYDLPVPSFRGHSFHGSLHAWLLLIPWFLVKCHLLRNAFPGWLIPSPFHCSVSHHSNYFLHKICHDLNLVFCWYLS